MTVRLIPPRVPWLDERTGLIAREWYLFLGNFVSTADGTASGLGALSSSSATQFAMIQAEIMAISRPSLAAVEQKIAELYALVMALRRPLEPPEPPLSTGANTPILGTNKPGSAVTLSPQKWETVIRGGVAYIHPLWI